MFNGREENNELTNADRQSKGEQVLIKKKNDFGRKMVILKNILVARIWTGLFANQQTTAMNY